MHHYVSKRVATKVKLVGCPARRLELLDSVDPGEFDVDYLKKHVAAYDVVDVGPGLSSNTSRSNNTIVSKPILKPKQVAPAKITDEKCAKMYPVNCHVNHKKFGTGIVKKIEDGIITIAFDKGGNKELGIDFCIKNKLLEKP